MAAKGNELNLAGILEAELSRLDPDQVVVFRAELARTIPAAIKAASHTARSANQQKGADTMATNTGNEVRQALAAFKERKIAVERDRDLSPEGREKRLKALRAEQDAYRPQAAAALAKAWKAIRAEYVDWQARAAQAEQVAGARWDYSRLAYEASAARAALLRAVDNTPGGDFDAARRVYEQWANSGDLHRQRAMLEAAPEVLADRFGAMHSAEIGRLIRDAARRLAQVLDTPELAALRRAGEDLTNRAVELHKATLAAGQFYDPAAGNPFSIGNEFSRLLDGVTITERVDAETLNTIYTLAIAEPSAEPVIEP